MIEKFNKITKIEELKNHFIIGGKIQKHEKRV